MSDQVIFPSSGQKTIPAYIRLSELKQLLPLSSATIWRKTREGSFVRPVKLSSRITAWPRAAVIAWIAEKEAQSQNSF